MDAALHRRQAGAQGVIATIEPGRGHGDAMGPTDTGIAGFGRLRTISRCIAGATVAASLCCCATPAPPGIQGRWVPVNRFAASPDAIPLDPPHAFVPSTLDRTLKTLLTRWAADAGLQLDYRHPSDFALYGPVSRIHAERLPDAIAALNAAYRQQHVVIALDASGIVVRQGDASVLATAAAAATP